MLLWFQWPLRSIAATRKPPTELVRHSINNDVVDADAIRERCSAFGIPGAVGPFPGVADIGIVADGDHDVEIKMPRLLFPSTS